MKVRTISAALISLLFILFGAYLLSPVKASFNVEKTPFLLVIPEEIPKNKLEKIQLIDDNNTFSIDVYPITPVRDTTRFKFQIYGIFDTLGLSNNSPGFNCKIEKGLAVTTLLFELTPDSNEIKKYHIVLKDKTDRRVTYETMRKYIGPNILSGLGEIVFDFPIEYNLGIPETYPKLFSDTPPKRNGTYFHWENILALKTITFVEFTIPYLKRSREINLILGTILISLGSSFLMSFFYDFLQQEKQIESKKKIVSPLAKKNFTLVCLGLKLNGEPCRRKTKHTSQYCPSHRNQLIKDS